MDLKYALDFPVVLVLAGIEFFFVIRGCVLDLGCSVVNRGGFVIAELCLDSVIAFSALTSPHQWVGLGMHKKLWGDTAGSADSNWPKGSFMPCDITLLIQSWGKKKEEHGGTLGVLVWKWCDWLERSLAYFLGCLPMIMCLIYFVTMLNPNFNSNS